MDKYAMFTYRFTRPSQKDLIFEGDASGEEDLSDETRRKRLDALFGEENTEFRVYKTNKSDADNYPCTVLFHTDRIVLLRLVNPKYVPYYKVKPTTDGRISDIDKTKILSSPYIYIVIDCREGREAIAMSINNDAWRDLERVAAFVQESINNKLDLLKLGFNVVLIPQKIHRDFIDYSRELIKKRKLSVTKMTFYFTGGTINPELEAIIKGDGYLSTLLNKYVSKHCEVSYSNPETRDLLDGRSRTLEHIVTLVCSDPLSEAFRLRISYDDGTTLVCGKALRMVYEMDEMTFESMRGFRSLFPEQEIGAWLDCVMDNIKEERNAAKTNQAGEAEAA